MGRISTKQKINFMAQLVLSTTINTSVEKVWNAISNSASYEKWLKNIKVETNWVEGASITFTCYDEQGNVLQWNNMAMIWEGVIKTIIPNKELTCIYPSKSTGLEEESYMLESITKDVTKVTLASIFISQEVADGYKEGIEHTLRGVKEWLEVLSQSEPRRPFSISFITQA